jgi:hypothetical protein
MVNNIGGSGSPLSQPFSMFEPVTSDTIQQYWWRCWVDSWVVWRSNSAICCQTPFEPTIQADSPISSSQTPLPYPISEIMLNSSLCKALWWYSACIRSCLGCCVFYESTLGSDFLITS